MFCEMPADGKQAHGPAVDVRHLHHPACSRGAAACARQQAYHPWIGHVLQDLQHRDCVERAVGGPREGGERTADIKAQRRSRMGQASRSGSMPRACQPRSRRRKVPYGCRCRATSRDLPTGRSNRREFRRRAVASPGPPQYNSRYPASRPLDRLSGGLDRVLAGQAFDVLGQG